jgi:hypothetical protein
MQGTYKNIIQIGLASLADNTTTNVLQYLHIFAISYTGQTPSSSWILSNWETTIWPW